MAKSKKPNPDPSLEIISWFNDGITYYSDFLDLSPINDDELDIIIKRNNYSESEIAQLKRFIYKAMSRDRYHEMYILLCIRYFYDFTIIPLSINELKEISFKQNGFEIENLQNSYHASGPHARQLLLNFDKTDKYGILTGLMHELLHTFDNMLSALLSKSSIFVDQYSPGDVEAETHYTELTQQCINNMTNFVAYIKKNLSDFRIDLNALPTKLSMQRLMRHIKDDKSFLHLERWKMSAQKMDELSCYQYDNALYCETAGLFGIEWYEIYDLANQTDASGQNNYYFYSRQPHPLIAFASHLEALINIILPQYPKYQHNREVIAFFSQYTSLSTALNICHDFQMHHLHRIYQAIGLIASYEIKPRKLLTSSDLSPMDSLLSTFEDHNSILSQRGFNLNDVSFNNITRYEANFSQRQHINNSVTHPSEQIILQYHSFNPVSLLLLSLQASLCLFFIVPLVIILLSKQWREKNNDDGQLGPLQQPTKNLFWKMQTVQSNTYEIDTGISIEFT